MREFVARSPAKVQGWFEAYEPFWEVGEGAAGLCEAALGRHPRIAALPRPLSAYLMQVAGVTVQGSKQVLVFATCSWEDAPDPSRYASELVLPGPHAGTCDLQARCSLETGTAFGVRFGGAPRP